MDKQLEVALLKIINGCRGIKEDHSVSDDAKELATLVIRDINLILKGLPHHV